MREVRVLVGTRKGAFVLTSDARRARWGVSGPHRSDEGRRRIRREAERRIGSSGFEVMVDA